MRVKKMGKKVLKESIHLTGADIANMLGGEAVEAYNQSKDREVEIENKIKNQKKSIYEMFNRLDNVILSLHCERVDGFIYCQLVLFYIL